MFDFVIFIAANRNGKVTADQKNQLNMLIGALADRRIHLRWIVPDARISVLSIARILRTAHFACRKKGVLVHNEIMTDGKSITKFASGVLKILPVDTRSEASVMRNDVCCLQNGNAPTGCSFHSCLAVLVFWMCIWGLCGRSVQSILFSTQMHSGHCCFGKLKKEIAADNRAPCISCAAEDVPHFRRNNSVPYSRK